MGRRGCNIPKSGYLIRKIYCLREKGKIMKLLKFLIITAIFFQLICPLQLLATEKVEKLKQIDVDATRNPLALKNLPTSVTVITQQQIEEKSYINVENMLREELGLDVVQNGALGSNTTVFTRGAGSSSTLVLVDGVQINSNTTGSFNFAHIQPENIEKVEILRGPQSTIWGADAVGGVINIVTKKGKGAPSHYFAFEGGSFFTFKETLGSSGEIGKFDYSATVSRTDSQGFSSADEFNGNTENDGYQNTSLSIRSGINFLDEKGRAEFIGRYIDNHVEFDNFIFGIGNVDGPPFSRGESFYLAGPISFVVLPWWDIKFNPNISYDSVKSRAQTFPDSNVYSTTYTLDIQNNFIIGEFLSLVVGGEYQNRIGRNVNTFNRHLENWSVFMQGVLDLFESFIFTAGFRFDDNSAFEDKLTYKFEAAYRVKNTGTRVRATYATGFRAPTLNDLFFPGFSNPNLLPEKVKNWEVGFDQAFWGGKATLSVVYFDSDYDNLIQFSLVTFRPENIGRATSQGVESSLKIKLPQNFLLTMNYTWNRAIDDVTKQRLRRRAQNKFHANIQHTWQKKLSSLLGITYKSNTFDIPQGTGGYVLLRAVLQYKINKFIKVSVRGENLLDKQYQEILGFGTAGISGYAGFTINF